MAPHSDRKFNVSCENGFEGKLSGDALGRLPPACSNLSFSDKNGFDETCARQNHLLRDYMLEHPEAAGILEAID